MIYNLNLSLIYIYINNLLPLLRIKQLIYDKIVNYIIILLIVAVAIWEEMGQWLRPMLDINPDSATNKNEENPQKLNLNI